MFSHGFHLEPAELNATAVFIEGENTLSRFKLPELINLGKWVWLTAFVPALLIQITYHTHKSIHTHPTLHGDQYQHHINQVVQRQLHKNHILHLLLLLLGDKQTPKN